jgi:hypothetical protein
MTKNVLVYVLALVGSLVLLCGLAMDTTVESGGTRVNNIGLLNTKLVRVESGFGFIALAALLRILAVVEAIASLYKRR